MCDDDMTYVTGFGAIAYKIETPIDGPFPITIKLEVGKILSFS